MNIKDFFSQLSEFMKPYLVRFDQSSLGSAESVAEFVRTRAAYIAQTALFGYLKARMGTRFRSMFEDETFSEAIQIASVRVFLSCLADLAIYCAAMVARKASLSAAEAEGLARLCFDTACNAALADVDVSRIPDDPAGEFARRLRSVDWQTVPDGPEAFTESEADLVRFAPVIDKFKEMDQEIVTNSIRFRWRDVREQVRKRLDGEAIGTDWKRRLQAEEYEAAL